MSKTVLHGLPPIVSADTRLLILGSFPGVASLRAQQYYAHPQNQFWKILQSIWPNIPMPGGLDSYEERTRWLFKRGLGLWDVYASCEREGSLDSAIRNAQVNDFAALRLRCPHLSAMAHNGGESFRHARSVQQSLSIHQAQELPVFKLPSSSPAHASWSLEKKCAAWREVIAACGLM